jgi:hypothetical protein
MHAKHLIVVGLIFVLVLGMAPGMVGAATSQGAPGRPTATHVPAPTATPTARPPIDFGSLYGDLYVILRDENGVPILDEFGCIQPIAADGTVLTLVTDPVLDLLCELTPELAELVQAVDFGRLNLGRAPEGVIAHAFDEAVNTMNSAKQMRLDPAGRMMVQVDDEWKTIDAPAENLALYIKMMKDGHWITTNTDPVEPGGGGGGGGNGYGGGGGGGSGDGQPSEPRPVLSDHAISLLTAIGFGDLGDVNHTTLHNNELLLAASLLAAAADKGGTMTLDKVIYINSIYGINQLGTLAGEIPDKTYYDFRTFAYDQPEVYGTQRSSLECSSGPGFVWVLTPSGTDGTVWVANCMNILSEVQHMHDDAQMGNVRDFVQASDDALQVIEYIHNYRVPVILPDLP